MASHDYDMRQSYPPYRYLALFGSRNEGLAGNHMGSAEDVWTLTAVYSPIYIYIYIEMYVCIYIYIDMYIHIVRTTHT